MRRHFGIYRSLWQSTTNDQSREIGNHISIIRDGDIGFHGLGWRLSSNGPGAPGSSWDLSR
jgi:hypothetical protein